MTTDHTPEPANWIDTELSESQFSDIRLGKRFKTLVRNLAGGIGETIPMACQDWAGTKAAYRFFSNDRVSDEEILSGHFAATRTRFDALSGTTLVLHDTTELTFKRDSHEAIGITNVTHSGRRKDGRRTRLTVCGMLQHSSLVVTPEGLPLGFAAIKFWTRKEFKGCNALKRHINPTRVPIEQKESIRWLQNLRESTERLADPGRCVHVGDRESDIYELFCEAMNCGTHFLFRTCVNRLAGDGDQTVEEIMAEVPVLGVHTIEVKDKKGKPSKAVLEIRCKTLQIQPPVGKAKRYPPMTVTVIHAQERGTPKDRDKVDWKLITDLSVANLEEAVEKLNWYAMRWKIEVFHKILKSGCRVEDSRLRTAERLVRLVSVFCILSWRIFWMTMINRESAAVPCAAVFTPIEKKLLDRLVPGEGNQKARKGSLQFYINKLARLGGYLNRANDKPPGNIVMWRGLSRLTDIVLGFEMSKDVGN